MDPSRATSGTPAALPEVSDDKGLQIWIPLPLAALGVLIGVVACLLVLGPDLAGSILALGFFTLLPGLAVVRLMGLHDPVLEIVLGIALSFAIAGLVSVVQAYFGGWSPSLTLGALVATTVAAVVAPRAASHLRARRRPSSVPAAPGAASPVAWPTATRRVGDAPLYVRPRSVRPELVGAPAPAASGATVAPVAPLGPAVPVASVAPAAPVAPGAAVVPVDPTSPAPGRSRSRQRGALDPAPPPPVAVVRKRPRAAPGSPAAGSRPNRATRSAIDHLVDNLSDQRDRTQS